MQIDTLLPYAKSYADSTFSLILHHIQINVMPKYMLHVGTVKSMYLKRKQKPNEQKKQKNILLILLNVQ